MARTTKGSKGPGYDYWKRRLYFSTSCGYGSDVKRQTNRTTRRLSVLLLVAEKYDAVEVLNLRSRGMTPTVA